MCADMQCVIGRLVVRDEVVSWVGDEQGQTC